MVCAGNAHGTGKWAEQLACEYLTSNGLVFLDRNYRGPGGEIDLIMQEESTIVFIEVKYRKNENYYDVLESIDKRKCDRIIKTGLYYQQSAKRGSNIICRFDIVAISGDRFKPQIKWIRNAFHA